MDEPWYESTGPNNDYIYKDMMTHFSSLTPSLTRRRDMPIGQFTDTNIAYSIMNLGYLSLLVKEKMTEEYNKFGGYGSYRGYATFARRSIIESVLDSIILRKKKIAFHKLCNSRILQVFRDSILYKPGKLRVQELEEEFNSLIINSS